MKVIVSIQHPAHVHFFKNVIWELTEEGHSVHVFTREKDVAVELLNRYDIDHEVLAGSYDGLTELAKVQLKYEYRLYRRAKNVDPDLMMAIGSPAVAHVASITNARSLIFTDTEHAKLQNRLTFPFADRICTPECYRDALGPKQVRYPGYHELAYLHPNHFEPDESIFENLPIEPNDSFVVLRLISWGAVHDIGDSGFTDTSEVIETLEETGTNVLVTAEMDDPDRFSGYQVTVPPHRIHHLLYYADLFVGESATMATESAVLGTPAVFVSSSDRSYTEEIERKYGLVFNFTGPDRHRRGLERAVDLLTGSDMQHDWDARRRRLLSDARDTTEVIREQVFDLRETSR